MTWQPWRVHKPTPYPAWAFEFEPVRSTGGQLAAQNAQGDAPTLRVSNVDFKAAKLRLHAPKCELRLFEECPICASNSALTSPGAPKRLA